MPLFNLFFLGVGLAWGWGVRRFHIDSIIYVFSNPTEFLVNRTHPVVARVVHPACMCLFVWLSVFSLVYEGMSPLKLLFFVHNRMHVFFFFFFFFFFAVLARKAVARARPHGEVPAAPARAAFFLRYVHLGRTRSIVYKINDHNYGPMEQLITLAQCL